MSDMAGATPLPIVPSKDRKVVDRVIALDTFFAVLDLYTLNDIGEHLTCTETEAMCDLYAAYGMHPHADALREGHAHEDDEGDTDHNFPEEKA